jgi:hypothetical protein
MRRSLLFWVLLCLAAVSAGFALIYGRDLDRRLVLSLIAWGALGPLLAILGDTR